MSDDIRYQIRKSEALKNAGMMSEEEFIAKKAELEAQLKAATQQQPSPGNRQPQSRPEPRRSSGGYGGGNRNQGGYGRQSGGGGSGGARRTEYPEYYRAQYRFVSYHENAVVRAEPEALEPINKPKFDGLCAEIELEWEAETPLLIGRQDDRDAVVVPYAWKTMPKGQQGAFIPGTTIRGAIRSVCEIVGGGRMAMNHVNSGESFAVRDFTHRRYAKPKNNIAVKDDVFQLAGSSGINAGWLRLADGCRISPDRFEDAEFVIEPAKGWHYLDARLAGGFGRLNYHEFAKHDIEGKYRAAGILADGAIAPRKHVSKFSVAGKTFTGEPVVKADKNGNIEGHYVFSGKAPDPKRRHYEYVFIKSETPALAAAIPPAVWKRFVKAHSRAVDEKLIADGSLKGIPELFAKSRNLQLPVFYVGSLDDMDPSRFAFGLTRLFKVPHRLDLKDVLKESGVRDPLDKTGKAVDPAQLDMVDALFGYVYEQEGASGAVAHANPSDFARKGRIAFSPANLVPGEPEPRISETIETVMMGPKPSFAPFYLAGPWKDYSAPANETPPRIAGRKRYPLSHVGEPGQALNTMKSRLEAQVKAIQSMNQRGEVSGDVVAKLKFLIPGSSGKKPRFRSLIRLFNVTQAELGLVLHAITHDGQDNLRFAIGRAKGYGAGQMKLTVTRLSVQPNKEEAVTTLASPAYAALKPWIDRFNAHVASQPGCNLRLLETARNELYSMCNPAVGAQMLKAGSLIPLRLRETRPNTDRGENPYQKLRDQVKPSTDLNSKPAGPDRLLSMPPHSRKMS